MFTVSVLVSVIVMVISLASGSELTINYSIAEIIIINEWMTVNIILKTSNSLKQII